jgi:hypothetical protein
VALSRVPHLDRLYPIPIQYGHYEGSERLQKYPEKCHPAARVDYSCLDVELDLTIQFEMSDDGRRSENPGLRGKD